MIWSTDRPLTRLAMACTLASALACTCHPGPGGFKGTTAGELGKGIFSYRCFDDTDGACSRGGEKPTDFPEAIAVGGRFLLEYESASGGTFVRLDSPTSQVAFDGEAFTAVEPGWAAIVAYQGDAAFDLLHVQIVEPHAMTMSAETAPLAIGDEVPLAVTVRDLDGKAIAGALDYVWSVDPPGIVELVGEDPTAKVRAVAVAPGVAKVMATNGELGVFVELEVLPGEDVGETGSTGDTGVGGAP